ncbi:MAG TPA: hypothetical protein VK059_06985, partial [Nocardioidaceae bacterium]|nr:hypothetical protein [Nocardioidaceae bacterium]
RNSVIVRSPDIELLGPRLAELGGFVEVDPQDDDSVAEGRQPRYAVKRLSLEEVGDAAYEAGVRLHELFLREATLEEAFLDATASDQEFGGLALPPEITGGEFETGPSTGEFDVRPADSPLTGPPPTHGGG